MDYLCKAIKKERIEKKREENNISDMKKVIKIIDKYKSQVAGNNMI